MAQTRTLTVLVDMDQVLCDFEGGFLSKYREKFPGEPFIPLEERNTFYIVDQYAKLRKDLRDRGKEIMFAEGFFHGLQPIDGACEAVIEMSQMEDVEVFICTSPMTDHKYCVSEKFQWVEDHLGSEWTNKIIISKDKSKVHGDLLIDDRPRIPGVQEPSWKQVLFSAPHNLHSDLKGRTRLNNWTDQQWRHIVQDFQKRK